MSKDLGLVRVLGADAVGQPGQRRFRLFAQTVPGSVLVWMEKEQLAGLSEALDRALALITEGQILRTEAQAGARPLAQSMPQDFPTHPSYELQAGQIRLNYDEQASHFLLYIVPIEVVIENEQPQVILQEDELLSITFTRQQAQAFSKSIVSLLSAGRPVCPLCRAPLDGGPHACVKQNGHRKIVQVDEDE